MKKLCHECKNEYTPSAKNIIYCSKICQKTHRNKELNANWLDRKKRPVPSQLMFKRNEYKWSPNVIWGANEISD